MLKAMAQDHKQQQKVLRKQRDELRKQSVDAISRLTGVLLDSVNQGVAQVKEKRKFDSNISTFLSSFDMNSLIESLEIEKR